MVQFLNYERFFYGFFLQASLILLLGLQTILVHIASKTSYIVDQFLRGFYEENKFIADIAECVDSMYDRPNLA